MTPEAWTTTISLAQAGGSIATAGAFPFAIHTFLRVRKTEQVRLAESVFKDIRTLEKDLDIIKASSVNSESPEEHEKRLNSWRSRFCNTLEWFSFLVNQKEIKDKKLKAFFADAVIDWYSNIFLTQMGTATADPKQFPEFKKLYRKLSDLK